MNGEQTASERAALRYVENNPEKLQARRLAREAIRKGTLIRPDQCSRCPTKTIKKYGWKSNVEGHHTDYSKPLDVIWLCLECHKLEHRALRQNHATQKQ